jgi:beta-galactosidase
MRIVSVFCLLLISLLSSAQVRKTIDFNKDWKFYLGNDSLAYEEVHDDSQWRKLNLPHDWSIESDFKKEAPATNQGGSLPGGIGWYRKTFVVPASDSGRIFRIDFDGVYRNSEVWINGNYLGKRPYGYVPFSYELTKYLQFGKKNVIAVKVDNSHQPDSRYYTGSGIYRDVKLVSHGKVFIEQYGTFITTPQLTRTTAEIEVTTSMNTRYNDNQRIQVVYTVLDQSGRVVKEVSPVNMQLYFEGSALVKRIKMDQVRRWSPETPVTYTLRTQLYSGNKLLDEDNTTFGFRSIRFDGKNGFYLNDQPYFIKGVCMHHDLGALGAAYNNEAARRQLRILKEMGCNAIRVSHNPPAADFLDLCDQMGFLVMDEAFDTWNKKKNKFDYHLDFKEWYKADLEAMVYRDRNHPSVFMWSIGNEIRNQFDSSGTIITKELVDIVKAIDRSRPVTCALTETNPEKNFIYQSIALDVLGFNYKDFDYPNLPVRFPGQSFLATETASALSTRGVYQFPADLKRVWPADYKEQDTFARGNADYTCAAYDNTHAYWGNTHEKSWLAVKKNKHMAGLFVWSGFDYLGEPLPYPAFPARSSYYGIVDLAGFPKDVYYMYQSEWTDKPVLHLFPHWNWNSGDTVDVWAFYSKADEVELFLNDKSLGIKRKIDSSLRVSWRVPYIPGKLKAVSRLNSKIVQVREIRTAGAAARIELVSDKKSLRADGKDLAFIRVRLLDRSGNLVPGADKELSFTISGAALLDGTDNGYPADTLSLKSGKRSTWKGQAIAIIRNNGKKGNITLTVSAGGLGKASITLKATD